jgi:hypothetical protein
MDAHFFGFFNRHTFLAVADGDATFDLSDARRSSPSAQVEILWELHLNEAIKSSPARHCRFWLSLVTTSSVPESTITIWRAGA